MPNSLSIVLRYPALLLATSSALYLTGCGAISTPGSSTITTGIAGRVHGGRQPVAFSTITLYAPGTTGYGSAPTSIVSAVSDAQGNFTLPRPYTCPANSGNVYILATGGDPGAGTNPVLSLAAELGPCSSLSSSSFIDITEATTVAAAYTLAPFAAVTTGSTGIGTSSTNLLGLNNAFGPASNLVNTATGAARSVNELTGIVLPTPEINTLANILSACVNTTGTTGSTDPCGKLFAAATPPSGSAPTDTFQAAINIALNPGNNVAALYSLSTATVPFQPALSTAPSDFAVAIDYNGGPIAASGGTAGLDIDAQGNAWFALRPSSNFASVAEISPSGALLSGSNGFLSIGNLGIPQGLAIDSAGFVYAVDSFYNEIARIDSTGGNGVALFPVSLNGPYAIAIDNRNASIWVTNNGQDSNGNITFTGTTVTHMTSANGTELTGSPFGGQDGPMSVAIDAAGSAWIANSDVIANGNGYLTRLTPAAPSYAALTFASGIFTFPFGVAIDNSSNAWVVDTNGIAKFSNAGSMLSPAGGYALSLATSPFSVVIDGLGRAFSANASVDATNAFTGAPGSVAVFSAAGTLLSTSYSTTTSSGNFLGYSAAGALPVYPFTPDGLKIDPSGNVWVTGRNPSGAQFVSEILGLAAPVTTPVSVASSTSQLGIRP